MATSTCSKNFIDLHEQVTWAVNEFHAIIRNLASYPHAGSIQTLVKDKASYIQNFTQYLITSVPNLKETTL